MSSKSLCFYRRCAVFIFGLFFGLTVTGCASGPFGRFFASDSTPEAALAYYNGLSRLTPAELGRERNILTAGHQTPSTQVRMALLLGHPRVQQDLGKGLGLLENVLKSNEPAALSFHPLARQLADNYQERLRLEGQFEKQGLLLKDSQRRSTELQEKLDSLANIENSLIPRPRAVRPEGVKR